MDFLKMQSSYAKTASSLCFCSAITKNGTALGNLMVAKLWVPLWWPSSGQSYVGKALGNLMVAELWVSLLCPSSG